MEVEYSPFDPAIDEDPSPIYARLLAKAPLYRNEKDDFWALSRHADVVAGLQDHVRFSSSHGPLLDTPPWGPDAAQVLSFVAMDPPRHTALRTVVSRGFTARRVAALESRIREIVRYHLDAALQRDGGAFDFMRDFAFLVPLDVIAELLGVPPADRAHVRRLMERSLKREEGTGMISQEGLEAGAALSAYWAGHIAERRRAPKDDLVSVMIDGLSDEEIIPILYLLLSAGSETTTNLLGHAWYWAWRNPDQREHAFGDVVAWAEETLRYDPPGVALARLLTEDTEFHGTRVPAGSRMWLVIAAANRDPRAFPDPDRYDLGRDTSKAISFSAGRHFCMGAALARLETRIALEQLAAAVSDYEIDPEGLRRTMLGNARGLSALPTKVALR